MREYFNEHLLKRLTSGEFRTVLLKEKHANPATSGQVFCTYSQMLALVDKDEVEVAMLHQYLLPDKTVGGSKLPDPVRIEWQGKVRKLKPKGS